MMMLWNRAVKLTILAVSCCFVLLLILSGYFYGPSGLKSYTPWLPSPTSKKAIVAAARADVNTAWMKRVGHSWEPFAYNVDDQDANTTLRIPKNKGHEAMVYLSFILDRWDELPRYTVFVHGHEKAWHQENDLVPLIRNMRLDALDQAGYVPLRCDWYPSCPAEIKPITHDTVVWGPGVHRQDAEDGIVEVWDRFFPNTSVPETIASQCCAQFAVTDARIRSRSRETYATMRNWLLETPLIDDISGRVLEKLWAYIFTNEPVHCPAPDQCACHYFGSCEPRDWPKPPPELGSLPE